MGTASSGRERHRVKIEQKIADLGLEMPNNPPNPASKIEQYRRAGNIVYLSGHGPSKGGVNQYIGKLGKEFTTQQGYEAAKLTTLNLLESLKKCIGDLDKVTQVVKLLGLVNSTLEFTEQPAVINGATELLIELYGDAGRHARSAVGMAQLPGGMAVEIEMIVEVAD
jgi:enamine deaminase RidA (YjgF/YER057c/UK114 family)